MALDPVFLQLEKWADTGDRTDPDDSSLDPALVEATGYPASFSAEDGNTPRRAVVNEILYRFFASLIEIRDRGLLEWDAGVDYQQYAIVQGSNGSSYRAKVATGPATSNATDPTTDTTNAVWDGASSALGTTGVPDAPNAPVPTSFNGRLDFRWNCPRDNGAPVTSFIFQWRVAGAAWSDTNRVTVNPSSGHHTLTGLTNGVNIEARVLAVNSNGNGPFSQVGSGAPAATRPDRMTAPVLVPVVGGYTVYFAAPDDGGSEITGFQIQYRSGTQAWSSSRQVAADGSPVSLSGLPNGTAHQVRIRAVNAVNPALWSDHSTETTLATTVPDQVNAPSVIPGEELLDVYWIAPDDGGDDIDGYRVQWRSGNQAWSSTRQATVTGALTHRITGLGGGTEYEVRVLAFNGNGDGAFSEPSTGTPEAAPEPDTVPGRMTAPTLVPGTLQLGVIVVPPNDDGGQELEGFRIQWRETGGSWSTSRQRTITGRETTIGGLTGGQEYEVRALAFNSIGDGPFSLPATGTPRVRLAAEMEWTEPGTYNWNFIWPTTRARIEIVAGSGGSAVAAVAAEAARILTGQTRPTVAGGGDGGGNGGNGGNGGAATRAGDGKRRKRSNSGGGGGGGGTGWNRWRR